MNLLEIINAAGVINAPLPIILDATILFCQSIGHLKV